VIDLGRGTKLITRAEWGARRPRSTSGIVPSFGTTCHWEGPRMGSFPHGSCFTKVRVIQDFHMDTRGWVDVAYTALVCPHGFVFEGRWLGRRTAANGTNVGNASAYALCYLGGEGDGFTAAGKTAMRAGLDWLDGHGAAGGRNGHRDWKPTACPGDDIYLWVRSGQPAGAIEEDDMPLTTDDLNKVRAIVKDEIAKARASYIEGAAQKTHEQLNKALDPDTGWGSVIRTALLEMAERGVGESLREGHALDVRLDALAGNPEPPAEPAG
jgi:hypothetical protein